MSPSPRKLRSKASPLKIDSTPSRRTRQNTSPTSPISTKKRLTSKIAPDTPTSNLLSPISEAKSTSKWRFNSIGVPQCPLPCRESQFEEIWTFMNDNITQKTSSCMYVSGVPGTGKTLIVQSVVDCLSRYAEERKEHLKFSSVYINGLSLGSPDKIWKKLLTQLENKKVKHTPALALKKLNTFFETKGRLPVVLVVDELDQLLDKKQSILYQLLEWSTKPTNMFSLIAIFNTMSLPENALVMRNVSRMGFVRCIFSPYTHEQLQLIIKSSLEECKSGKIQDDAILLLSKKVAAVSGDARRALEIARRAVEIVECGQVSGIMGVNAAFKEIFSSVKVDTIKYCSSLEQAVLKLLTQELESAGTDEATLMSIFSALCTNSVFDGHNWSKNQFMGAVTKLNLMKLIIAENESPSMHKKVSLNVPFEDVNYALGWKSTDQT